MTGWQPPGLSRFAGVQTYIVRWKEAALMTAFEIISIFIGILVLLIAFGSFVIALLAFLNKKRNKRKK